MKTKIMKTVATMAAAAIIWWVVGGAIAGYAIGKAIGNEIAEANTVYTFGDPNNWKHSVETK